VDDLIISAKNPNKYMNQIEQELLIRNKADSPSYYLGNDIKKVGKLLHISSKKYVNEVLRRFRLKYGEVRKESLPMTTKVHPEMDDSSFLNKEEIKQYQHIIGVSQWLVVAGRFDITYAVSSLSRFSAAPRQGHLALHQRARSRLLYRSKNYTYTTDLTLSKNTLGSFCAANKLYIIEA
jgi:hypothetical protein